MSASTTLYALRALYREALESDIDIYWGGAESKASYCQSLDRLCATLREQGVNAFIRKVQRDLATEPDRTTYMLEALYEHCGLDGEATTWSEFEHFINKPER